MECNWYRKDENRLLCPSKRLKFLNKACVIRDAERDLTADGEAKNPWKLCTVQQVEDLKSLLRVIPIWSTGVIFNVISAQPTFPVLQAQSMNRQITRNFSIPAGSFGIFTIVSIISWILVYNRVVLPLASKFKGAPVHINAKTRIGVGLFFSFLAMAVTSLVESIRRSIAIKEGLAEFPKATVPMSALWLIPQNALVGFAEASFLTSQVEFYYSEIPKSISSIVWGLSTLSGCFGSLLASVVLSTVDKATREVGSWVSSNINKGHYDDYYLVLGGISMGNFIYFLACSYAYGPMQEEEHMKETSEY
ncbi:proton-dependent oligopeptide transport family protein [Genlisea aurea]|uniref:Proton-dependent oligopeptide transport family protein n=1 Tax=Genlisea aurea TaxID=192259 RepID=S8ELK6_9LAMI|nr:proton-dependent oligopeptide transport family protein [Genlisea aurea]